jgi:hypothetical protein
VVIEPIDKEIISFDISKERNMFVASEPFLSHIIKEYGEHPVSTDVVLRDTHRLVSF